MKEKSKKNTFSKILLSLMMGFSNALGLPYSKEAEKKNNESNYGRTYKPDDDGTFK